MESDRETDYERLKRKKQEKKKAIILRNKRKQKDNEKNPRDKPVQRR